MPWPWQRAFCPAAAAAAEKKQQRAATEAADAKETTAAEKETEKETEKADEGEKKQALSVSLDAEPDSLDLAKVSDMYSTTVVSQMIEGPYGHPCG